MDLSTSNIEKLTDRIIKVGNLDIRQYRSNQRFLVVKDGVVEEDQIEELNNAVIVARKLIKSDKNGT